MFIVNESKAGFCMKGKSKVSEMEQVWKIRVLRNSIGCKRKKWDDMKNEWNGLK